MTKQFAIFGAAPEFDQPLPVGQLYFPSWERYTAAFHGIFERQYYTNQGPLTEQLEERLQQFLGVKHAVCVTNATIALMMVAEAMGLSGKVILPAFTFVASAQSLTWTNIQPVFCDVDPDTHQISVDQVAALIEPGVSAIMGVNLWGGACDAKALAELAAANGIKLYFDSAHAFGCRVKDIPIGGFGAAEVFSFHATKVLSATEGGCISTNDDDLAARLRNIRSSYGAGRPVDVVKTSNGRMSEAQAAVALMSLEDFPANQANNAKLYQAYSDQLRDVPGLRLVRPAGTSFSNCQYVVCEVDATEFGLSRDLLLDVMKAENVIARRYFHPGVHRTLPYSLDLPAYQNGLPITDKLCATCIQFPIGALVTAQMVERICNLLSRAHRAAPIIRQKHA